MKQSENKTYSALKGTLYDLQLQNRLRETINRWGDAGPEFLSAELMETSYLL